MRIAALTLLFIIGCFNTILGIYTFVRDPENRLVRSYCLLSLSIAGWAFALVTLHVFPSYALISDRCAFAFSACIAVCFYLFSSYLTRTKVNPIVRNTIIVLAIFMVFASAVGWITRSSTLLDGETYLAERGYVYPFFAVYFMTVSGFSVYILWRAVSVMSVSEKTSQIIVATGCTFSLVGGLLFNLILPLLFRNSSYNMYGPLWTTVFLTASAYQMLSGRYLDIRYAVSKKVTHLILLIMTISAYSLMVIFIRNQLVVRFDLSQDMQTLTLVVGIVIGVFPIHALIEKRIDIWFSGKDFLRKAMKQYNPYVKSLYLLAQEMYELAVGATAAKKIVVCMYDPISDVYRSIYPDTRRILLPSHDVLIAELAKYGHVSNDLELVRGVFQQLGYDACIGIAESGRIVAFVMYGDAQSKRGDELMKVLTPYGHRIAGALGYVRSVSDVMG